MKIKPAIKSTHDLKKEGYTILRKLHKLEYSKNLNSAYQLSCAEGYFVVLASQNLVDLIEWQYGHKTEFDSFKNQSARFLTHLNNIAKSKTRINKRILSSFLSCYTRFFNRILKERIRLECSDDLINTWNQKCVMAYVATWGNK